MLGKGFAGFEFVMTDFETTGLSPEQGHVVCEFGGVRYDHEGKELDSIELMVNPGRPIDPGASKVNGITDDMVKDCVPVDEGFARYLEFIRGTGKPTIAVAHNGLGFDFRFVAAMLHRYGGAWAADLVDTCGLSRRKNPIKNHSQVNVMQYYGLNIEEYKTRGHRALYDSVSLGQIFHRMCVGHGIDSIEKFRVMGAGIYLPADRIQHLFRVPPVAQPSGYGARY